MLDRPIGWLASAEARITLTRYLTKCCGHIKEERLRYSDSGFEPCSNYHLDFLSLQPPSNSSKSQSIVQLYWSWYQIARYKSKMPISLRCFSISVALLLLNYLFIVKSPGWINRHNQTRHDANEHSIERCTNGHTTQRQPEFCESLRRIPPVSNAQHMWHGFK